MATAVPTLRPRPPIAAACSEPSVSAEHEPTHHTGDRGAGAHHDAERARTDGAQCIVSNVNGMAADNIATASPTATARGSNNRVPRWQSPNGTIASVATHMARASPSTPSNRLPVRRLAGCSSPSPPRRRDRTRPRPGRDGESLRRAPRHRPRPAARTQTLVSASTMTQRERAGRTTRSSHIPSERRSTAS